MKEYNKNASALPEAKYIEVVSGYYPNMPQWKIRRIAIEDTRNTPLVISG